MKKELIDFKKISDENLIKLWVNHYKKCADNSADRLLDKGELQLIYDEGYKRGLGNTLIKLYNAIYAVHITARQDLNNGIARLFTHGSLVGEDYKKLGVLAQIYTYENLTPQSEEAKEYRDKIAIFLLDKLHLNIFGKTTSDVTHEITDNKLTVGEEIVENTVKGLKKSILFCRKIQEQVGRNIMSEEAEEQIKSARQVIHVLLGEIADDISYLEYTLGLMKDETGKAEEPDKDFYKLIDENMGVGELAKRMEAVSKIIDRQTHNESLLEELRAVSDDGKTASELNAILEKYPIENIGLSKKELDEIENDVTTLLSSTKMI